MKKAVANISSLENIIDPMLEGKYDMGDDESRKIIKVIH